MGNKVNPISFRLHQTHDWDSLWHDKSNFAKNFNEDILIKEFITNFFYQRNVSVSNFYINRNSKSELFIHFNIYLLNNKNSSKLFKKKFRRNFYLRKNLLAQSSLYRKKQFQSFEKGPLFNKKSWKSFKYNTTTLHLQSVPVVSYKKSFLVYRDRQSAYISNSKKKSKLLGNSSISFINISKVDLSTSLKSRLYSLLIRSSSHRVDLFKKNSFLLYKAGKANLQLNKQKRFSWKKSFSFSTNLATKSFFNYYLSSLYTKVLNPNLLKLNRKVYSIKRNFWKARFRRQRRYF